MCNVCVCALSALGACTRIFVILIHSSNTLWCQPFLKCNSTGSNFASKKQGLVVKVWTINFASAIYCRPFHQRQLVLVRKEGAQEDQQDTGKWTQGREGKTQVRYELWFEKWFSESEKVAMQLGLSNEEAKKVVLKKKKAPSEASVPITIAAFCTEGRSRGRCHLPRSRAGDVPNNLRVIRAALLLLLTHRQKRQSRKKKRRTQPKTGLGFWLFPSQFWWIELQSYFSRLKWTFVYLDLGFCSAHSKTRQEWQGRTAWGCLSSRGGEYPVRFFFLFLKLCNTVGKLK